MKNKLFMTLLLGYFQLFGIRTIGRNTPLRSINKTPATQVKKVAPTTTQETHNVHMPHMITPPDRHQMTQEFAHKNMHDVFAEIYHTNYWMGAKSRSGQGSSLRSTSVIRSELSVLCDALQIKTILDIGCGDYYWMQKVHLPDCAYMGVDIVPEMIELNRKHYADKSHHFLCLDSVHDPLPEAELVLCRDVIAHLNYDEACDLLRNVKASGSKFLLMSTHLETRENEQKHTGHHSPYNMTIPPFNLSDPLVLIEETSVEPETRAQRKAMGLWLLSDIDVDKFQA